jgi:hypothetical protein
MIVVPGTIENGCHVPLKTRITFAMLRLQIATVRQPRVPNPPSSFPILRLMLGVRVFLLLRTGCSPFQLQIPCTFGRCACPPVMCVLAKEMTGRGTHPSQRRFQMM